MSERFESWPDLRLTLHLAPWAWSLGFWRDEDMTSSFTLRAGPLTIEWWADHPVFARRGE